MHDTDSVTIPFELYEQFVRLHLATVAVAITLENDPFSQAKFTLAVREALACASDVSTWVDGNTH